MVLKPFNDAAISRIAAWLAHEDDFVFLESSRVTEENHRSFLFTRPSGHLICQPHDDAAAFLAKADQLREQGYFLAGWLAYEFGYLLEPRLRRFLIDDKKPLAVLGVYQEPLIFDHKTGLCSGGAWPGGEQTAAADVCSCADLRTSISTEEHQQAVQKIQEYIRAGDSYQVNFTLHFDFAVHGSVAALYCALRRNQSVAYTAWIRQHGHDVLSFSPELFFQADASGVRVRPMKGTMRRGRTTSEDEEQRQRLHSDAKNRSENVMIVDLLRNDLGRLLHAVGRGTVVPRALFEVETYASLLQMTSTVDAVPAAGQPSFRQLIEALFPCGSVTGAPKIRTMEIIRELERRPRGVYCGAVGWTSRMESCFNVPIRTLELQDGKGSMGIGSGIVADSNPAEEWQECLLKGNFLTSGEPDFQLIETMLWQPASGFFLLEYHLERLADSARYFQFACDINEIRLFLRKKIDSITEKEYDDRKGCYRVRLLLHREGRTEIVSVPLAKEVPLSSRAKVIFSAQQTDANNSFLYHKTTRRTLYDRERSKAVAQGYDEVLFTNLAGQVTEGAISNLFAWDEQKKNLVTPPISCGLLAGTHRQMLLEQGKAVEQIITKEDVLAAKNVYIVNSVRGIVRASVDICSLP